MRKWMFFIASLGLCFSQTVKAQNRAAKSSDNTTQQRVVSPSSAYRSGVTTNSLAPSSQNQRQSVTPKSSEWRTMNMQEKKDLVNSMSSNERTAFLHKMKENIVFEDLNIPSDKEAEFKSLFDEYQTAQKQIKEKFIIDNNLDKLSDDEAIKRLNLSFEVGQQLLDNRRKYATKFLAILTPQQVLKLFQTEGRLREKVLEKKNNSN